MMKKKKKEKKNIDLIATAFCRTLQKANIRLLTKSGSQKLNVVGTYYVEEIIGR